MAKDPAPLSKRTGSKEEPKSVRNKFDKVKSSAERLASREKVKEEKPAEVVAPEKDSSTFLTSMDPQ